MGRVCCYGAGRSSRTTRPDCITKEMFLIADTSANGFSVHRHQIGHFALLNSTDLRLQSQESGGVGGGLRPGASRG